MTLSFFEQKPLAEAMSATAITPDVASPRARCSGTAQA